MEQQKQNYKFLDQFIKDNFIIPDNIIYKDIEIVPQVNSVHITMVEQYQCVISIVQGYSTSVDKSIEQDNINRVMLNTSTLKEIMEVIR